LAAASLATLQASTKAKITRILGTSIKSRQASGTGSKFKLNDGLRKNQISRSHLSRRQNGRRINQDAAFPEVGPR
jgi:hypothetical protein